MKVDLIYIILPVLLLLALFFYYRRAIRPMRIISSGMDLLKGQDYSSRLKKTGQKDADEVVGLFNSLMDQLKEERLSLRAQNEFLDLLIKASPMGVVVLDYNDNISEINAAGVALLQLPAGLEFKGMPLREFSGQSALDLASIPLNATHTFNRPDGGIYKGTHSYFVDRGFRRSFFLIERLTEEVRKAEKEAYEQVIRMLAHEVNNSTAGITSILDTVTAELNESGEMELSDALSVCMDRCYSMSDFVSRLAEVVKMPKADLRSKDLNALIRNQMAIVESLAGEKEIAFRLQLDETLPPVMLDVPLMEQVFINIIKNAIESISGTDGEIVIRTSSEERILEVCDNGVGISDEAAGKLFSPFFSTKPQGQGIGLLFTREVLKQHGFRYSLHTDHTNHLTYFRIFL